MYAFSINIDLYERLTAIRRATGLSTSNYLERAKEALKDNKDFIVNGNIVNIKRGKTCLN